MSTCATCARALPVESKMIGFNATDYRHCSVPLESLPVTAWLIAANAGCGHSPSRWTPLMEPLAESDE